MTRPKTNNAIQRNAVPAAAALLVSSSMLALSSAPASAAEVLFSSNGLTEVREGQRTTHGTGILQVKLDSGATLSFTEGAEFTINADGSIDLYAGEVTVAGAGDSSTLIRMPDGVEGRVGGQGNAAIFNVAPEGEATGHTLTGSAWISRGGRQREFSEGEMWASTGRNSIRQVMTRGPAATPRSEPRIASTRRGGPIAAAENGQPVSLGDALAGAGASSDIVAAARRVEAAAANPQLETFPTGDLAQLVSLAARLENLYGGSPFPQAQADIIRAYLGFLAEGGAGNNFLAAYSGFLTQYLALIRAGGLPSDFDAASLADINAFLAFQGRTGALGNLGAQDAALAQAYLEFLLAGGNGADFSSQFTDLIEAYFAFVQGGGDPAQFTGASQEVLDAYIAFLNDSGLIQQLSSQYQQILLAYLQAGGFGFADQYGAALQAYLEFLQQGNLPSQYDGLDPDVILAYLETLQATGLFDQVLGAQSQFFADYLAYLQTGGNPDDYTGLPTVDLPAYADALNAYAQFLAAGGLPSDFTGTDLSLLANYLRAISNNGQLDALLGANAGLLQAYFDFLAGGGDIDQFSGLPVYADYVAALNAYYAFLAGGGLPSDYTALSQQQISAYLAALQAAGGLGAYGNLDDFFDDYLAFLLGGGDPEKYTGLPIYADYVAALNAYFAFLSGGGLPGDYTALTQQQIEDYLAALNAAGGFDAYGALNDFFDAYFAFLQGGGDPADFTGLPVYADYLAAIAEFYAFIAQGGLPSAYTALTQQQIQAYLAALANLGLLTGNFTGDELDFYINYLAYLGGGGIPDQFGGLPGNSGTYNGFALANGARAYIASPGSNGSASTAGGSVNAQGQPLGFAFQPAGELAIDVAGNGDAVIGRFASTNLHYMIINPIIGSLPASGAIDYDVVAATSPTYSDGATAPGTFDANLTIGFGTSLTYGIDGTITMPDATYTFASPGRANGDLVAPQVADPGFFVIRPDLSQSGSACQSNDCYLNMFGALGGDAGETAGFAYQSRDNFNLGQPFIEGSVIFGATGPAAGPDVTKQNQSFAFANPLIGDDIHVDIAVTYNSAGIPVGYVSADPNEALTVGDMTLSDTGTAGGVLGWARWNDGNPGGTWYGTPNEPVGPNGGYHVIAGSDLVNIPTSGAVEYDIVGFTTPTRHDESTSTGSVTGGAAVVFGANPVVALDLTVISGADSFNLFTSGKLTDPTQSTLEILPTGMFHTLGTTQYGPASSGAIFVDSASSFCTPSCNGFVEGFLAGDGASHMGLAYSIRGNTIPNQFIDGSVAFAKGDAIVITQPAFSNTYNVDLAALGTLSIGSGSAEVAANGTISTVTISNNTFAPEQGATLDEFGRFGDDVAFTSYIEGDNFYTNGTRLFLSGAPATNLPASGTVTYKLVGGVTPVDILATAGEEAFLTNAALGVSFGTTPRVGMEFDLYAADRGWHVQTTGGAANPGNGGLQVNTTSLSFNGMLNTSNLAGDACSAQCFTNVYGGLFGDGAEYVGFSYLLNEFKTDQSLVQGTAIFGRTGTEIDSLGTDPRTGGSGASEPPSTITNAFGTRPVIGWAYATTGADVLNIDDQIFLDGGSYDVFVDSNDDLVKLSYQDDQIYLFGRTDATVAESYDIGGFQLGRWTDGIIGVNADRNVPLGLNQSAHYVIADSVLTNLNLPGGQIGYELLQATSPTVMDGSLAPGVFDASLVFDFSTPSALKMGMEGTVTFSGPSGFVYSFATAGGLANPDFDFTLDSFVGEDGGRFFFRAPGTTDNGLEGTIRFFAAFGDEQGSTIGSIYKADLYDSSFNLGAYIVGGAVFGSTGPVGSGGGTGGGITSDFTGTRDSIVYYTYTNSSLASGFGGSADLESGELVNFTSLLGTVSKGSASVVEAGDVGSMAWGRWTNGTVETRTIVGNADTAIGPNGGYHVMAGTPTTYAALQSGARIDYDLIATTSATDNIGSAPGTVTGNLAIVPGSTPVAHYDFTMAVGGNSWSASSPAAGITVTSSSGGPIFGGLYSNNIGGTLSTTGNACQFSCTMNVSGAVFGANGEYVGVALGATGSTTANGNIFASGMAIFGAPGATSTAGAPSGSATSLSREADWARWDVPGEGISAGNGMAAIAPGLDAAAAMGIQFSPEQLQMLEAYNAARSVQ